MRSFRNWLGVGVVALAGWVVVLPVRAVSDPKPDDGRAELTGKWQVIEYESEGAKLPVLFSQVMKLDAAQLTYSMNLAVPLVGWNTHEGKFKIVSAEKKVFKVDFEYTNKGSIGESNQVGTSEHAEKGLWELVDKDKLRIISTERKDRPDKFETKKGDGRTLYVYERKK